MIKTVNFPSHIRIATLLCSSLIIPIAAPAMASAEFSFALSGYEIPVVPATTYALYVSPAGSDANPGSAAAPFLTLARAARATRPGTTVYVTPGIYAGGFKTTNHGSAAGRIAFVSTSKWGAKIVPSGKAKVAWDNRGNYVDIIGFHIDGTGSRWTGGIYNGGSYDTIRSNWVHDVARSVACNGTGGSAIGVDIYYGGVHSDVIGNLVHDIGPANCRFIHGIYISTSGMVKNNVVYRAAEGAIHLWHDANNVIITNNTVTASHTGIVGGGDFYRTRGPSDYNRIYNNIVYDNAMGISEQGKTGRNNKYSNNLVYKNTKYDFRLLNGLSHTATVASEPYFVGYTRSGNPDLRLSASSPAIGRGTPADAPAHDFAERPRNTGTGYDIGAFQH
ncbi:MAG: choice-of-anchor Q domain-containing protein [Pseudomonadota bacterium]